jgi:hypothetical protein
VGVNWSSSTTTGALLPSALSANWPGAAKVLFDYYWVPDSASTVSSTTDLQVDASVEWRDFNDWYTDCTWYNKGANSKGSSAALAANEAKTGTISLDYAVGAGDSTYGSYADSCFEIGFGIHYIGSL